MVGGRWAVVAAGLMVVPATALVTVTEKPVEREQRPDGERLVRSVVLANELASYTLDYDIMPIPGKPDEIRSHWWAWQIKYITLGMSDPSMANWYFQGFFNWYFDGESLYHRPATISIIRPSGPDAAVRYTWDTPQVTARITFALAEHSDKLLMLADYRPKVPVKTSKLVLNCYPTGFAQPRQRAVTTAKRTARVGERVELDLAAERWVLYEDTTPGRPGDGSAGLLVGTPDSFQSITVPVGDYGIVTTCTLQPEARSFGLALYSFPPVPDYEATRTYFREVGEREAEWVGRAAADPDSPAPPWQFPESRSRLLSQRVAKMLDRPAELWRPDPAPVAVPWAGKLAGGPLRTVLFCARYTAWETMELARRLDLKVAHLYADTTTALANSQAFPYARETGVGSIGTGPLANRAMALLQQPDDELIVVSGMPPTAFPGLVVQELLRQVRDGKGLLLIGNARRVGHWPKELFATPEADSTAHLLDGLDWQRVPGYEPAEGVTAPPVGVYRYGRGRVVQLQAGLGTYSTVVPRNTVSEGVWGAADRAHAVAARAALAAAGRPLPVRLVIASRDGAVRLSADPAPPAGARLRLRLQDDLDRTIYQGEPAWTADGSLPLPPVPGGRTGWLDAVLSDAQGQTLGFATAAVEPGPAPTISDLKLAPANQVHELAPPAVTLTEGGPLTASATVTPAGALTGAQVRWSVRDSAERLLGSAVTPVPAGGGPVTASFDFPRPVSVCHRLDAALVAGGRELAFSRLRFTVPLPYPYDDFRALVWTYLGGEPILLKTTRDCYEWGADLQDLSHLGGQDDARAAREYALAMRSELRLIPYVTRIFGEAGQDHRRRPGLHDPNWWARTSESLAATARQAAPYAPAAFTLGDENYLNRSGFECGGEPETIAAFRDWLKTKYGDLATLNRVWHTRLPSFDAVEPMWLEEAVQQTRSFAAWFDLREFLDTAFAELHDECARVIREQAPGARVGWDGFLNYHWQAGYDFVKLTRNLDLNQCYTVQWLQGEIIRSFRKPGALSGEWGNHNADNEAGWHAFPWDCLLNGENTVWWWTSWGCDYIPFNPDGSQSLFGKWFFESVRETTGGPGKLLLHAQRDRGKVAVLYSQRDLFAAALRAKLSDQAAAAGHAYTREHEALLRGLQDLGYQYHHLSTDQLAAGDLSPERDKVLFLSLAHRLSDQDVAALTKYVEAGGTLVVDGLAGLLTGDGELRGSRALDGLLGVQAEAGLAALSRPAAAEEAELTAAIDGLTGSRQVTCPKANWTVLEPGLKPAAAQPAATVAKAPVLLVNRFGQGRTVLLNLALADITAQRVTAARPLEEVLEAVVRGAGVAPFAEVVRQDGARPLGLVQTRFTDGALRYLAVQQDFMQPTLKDQPVRITLPQPAVVYDLRAGQRLGAGQVKDWTATMSRGHPLVYSLLPYEVRGVDLQAPRTARRGQAVKVAVKVNTTGQTGFHVVRLDVSAPDAKTPHRQYSINVACPVGAGAADVPLALDDRAGSWRLEARDVASGARATATVTVD